MINMNSAGTLANQVGGDGKSFININLVTLY